MSYFLGLCSHYSKADILNHTFAYGNEDFLTELRAYLAAHYGATYDHVAVYANGRTALSVALKAVTKRGSKVVVTSLTCYAVVQAVRAAGCIPIFADVDKSTLHFGAKELEKALEGEKDVQAVIVQNNLGIPVNIAEIEEVAKAHKLEIVEDLAHCAGVKYPDGREAGTVGRVAVLSFGKGKSIDTVTGGAVVFTNSMDTPVTQPTEVPKKPDSARARFYPLLSLIIRGGYNLHPKVGKAFTALFLNLHWIKRSADGDVNTKLRLTYWQCKLALRQMQALPRQGRQPIRDFFLVSDRETVLRKLEENGYIFNDVWYTVPVAPERYFAKADFHPETCPVATELARQIINFPTWYEQGELKPALKVINDYLIDQKSAEDFKDVLTLSEKKAKIKAEKAEHAKQKKAAKKSKKSKKSKKTKATEDAKAPEDTKAPETTKVATESGIEEKSKRNSANQDSEGSSRQRERAIGSTPVTTGRATGARGDLVNAIPEEKSSKPAKGNAVMRQAPKKLTDREKLKLELEKGKTGGPSVI